MNPKNRLELESHDQRCLAVSKRKGSTYKCNQNWNIYHWSTDRSEPIASTGAGNGLYSPRGCNVAEALARCRRSDCVGSSHRSRCGVPKRMFSHCLAFIDSHPRTFPPKDCRWYNVEEPLRMDSHLRGKIVLADFWTYCCVNCLHIIPQMEQLEAKYPPSSGVAWVSSLMQAD